MTAIFSILSYRVINGVKEMPGFRETLGLSVNSSNGSSGGAVCNEDVAEGTLLV